MAAIQQNKDQWGGEDLPMAFDGQKNLFIVDADKLSESARQATPAKQGRGGSEAR